MPPIPMKWIGPSLSGNLMNFILVRHETKHEIREPFGRVRDARSLSPRRHGAQEPAISPALPEEKSLAIAAKIRSV